MLDFTKPVQTRDGRKVVIYTTEAPGTWPVHGRIEGTMEPWCWGRTGTFGIAPSPCDLINTPPKMVNMEVVLVKERRIGTYLWAPLSKDVQYCKDRPERFYVTSVVVEVPEDFA